MIESNMSFEPLVVTDNKLTLAVAKNIPEGGYFSRQTKTEIGHNNGEVVYHPNNEFLIRSGENHILTKGSCTISYEINSVDKSEIIEAYTNHANVDAPDATIVVEGNTLNISWDVSFLNDTWSELKGKYAPLSDSAKIEVSEGSEFACFLRVDGEPEAWTLEYKDITANTLTTIEKEGNQCYVFFTNEVTKEDITLEAFKYYKLTSGNINVTPSIDTKVVRLYRD